MSLFEELKRRNVFRIAIAYIVTAWLLLQVADVVLNNIEAPDWVFKVFMLALGIGFPVAATFAWAFEITPDGLMKEKDVDRSQSITNVTGRKLDRVIMAVLALALGYFVVDELFFETEPGSQVVDIDPGVDGAPMAPVTAGDRSIAVLPFVNMSSDPEQEFFSDGISEELLNVLAQFKNLRVAARTSSFQFKGENLDIGKIAEQLKVAHVLEGSVRKSGTRLRITAQLIRADSGYHLWSDTYDRELDDVFAIQDEIATAIGDALEAQLGLGATVAEVHPAVIAAANTQAYEAFLHGRQLIHQRGREALEDAVRYLERSLRLDANYAPAHAQLAIATILLLESAGTYGDLSMEEVTRRATPHMNQAFELAPELASAHAARGLMAIHTGDWHLAVSDTRKALELNPSYTDAMNWQRIALVELGRYGEVQGLLDEMLEVDPLSVIARLNLANDRMWRGKPAEAHDVAEAIFPQSAWASYWKHADASLYEGSIAQSVEWGLKAYAENPNDLASNFTLMNALNRIGEYAEARRVSDALVAFADLAAGRTDDAVEEMTNRSSADPDNLTLIMDSANIAHMARRFDVAHANFEELARRNQSGKLLPGGLPDTLLLAFHRRLAGDEEGASQVAQVFTEEFDALIKAGLHGKWLANINAMLAAYHGEQAKAVEHLREAVELGERDPQFFSNAIFDEVRNRQEFIRLESSVLQALETERTRALQLICFRNPAPGAWQPLAQTCDGVREEIDL